MIQIRSSWSIACLAVGLGTFLGCPLGVHAQTFVELGGGWNYVAPAPEGESRNRGFNIRTSIGRQVAPRFRWRIDAFLSQFDYPAQFTNALCNPSSCTQPSYVGNPDRVVGLTANGLVNVDLRGIFYVIGGAGLYAVDGSDSGLHPGVSAGAGIAVPIGARLRAVAELRSHGLLGVMARPPWFAPITFGLRY